MFCVNEKLMNQAICSFDEQITSVSYNIIMSL